MKSFLFILFILMLPFDDFGWKNSSLGVFLNAGAALPLLLLLFHTQGLVASSARESIIFYIVMLYLLIYSLAYLLLFYINASYLNMLIIKLGALYIRFFLFAFAIWLTKNYYSEKYAIFIITAFSICLTGLIINLLMGADFNSIPFIHAEEANPPDRPRGFSLESSIAGTQLIIFGLLSIHLIKHKIKWLLLPLIITLAILSTSKGTVAVLAISSFLCSMLYMKKRPVLAFFSLTCIALPIAMASFIFLQDIFLRDMESYTSVATRLTAITAAILTVMNHPFGVGFGGYIAGFYEYIPNAVVLIKNTFPLVLNFREINDFYFVGGSKGIDAKSMFFDCFMLFGFPFLFGFIYIHYKLIRSFMAQSQITLIILCIFTSIALITFIPSFNLYLIAILYGFFWHTYIKNTSILNSTQ